MAVMRIIRFFVCFVFCFIHLIGAEETLTPDLTVMIPMRDGVSLPTDLYLPHPDAKGLPCILLRSPAGRQAHWKSFAAMSKLGYVIAIQDTRNVLDTEGKTFPFLTDGWVYLQDGYDTVEWLANSPYTNGKIGTWGSSALGITQLLMAPSNPPGLQCQYIIFAASSLYHHGLFPGGQLLKHQAESWLGYYARDPGVLSYVCHRPFYHDFWKYLNTLPVAHKVNTPAIHVAGWYDTFLQGSLDAFMSRQEEGGIGARGKQKLIIGPWAHFWPMSKHFGDFEVPAAGVQPPFDTSPQRWFDYYLKGNDNGIQDLPNVVYYVMGPFDGSPSSGNVWRTANAWPVPAQMTPFYLTSQKQLAEKLPASGSLAYQYDPNQPIPTLGGRNLFLESGPKDQQSIEQRGDILVFTSDVLAEDVEVTGPLSAKIFLTTNQPDTDIVLRFCDVYPDGRSILVSEGVYRVGVMCQQEGKKPYCEGEIVEANVDLWTTSLVFAEGHRIRVSVSSSNYPKYEKNTNVGLIGSYLGQVRQARNTILTGENYPSHLLLPIVRKGENQLIKQQVEVVNRDE